MPVFPPAAVSLPVTEILLELHATPAEQALIVIAPKETTVAAVVPVPVTVIELPVMSAVSDTAIAVVEIPVILTGPAAEVMVAVSDTPPPVAAPLGPPKIVTPA